MQIARLSLFFLVHELPFWPYRTRNVPQQNASDLNFRDLWTRGHLRLTEVDRRQLLSGTGRVAGLAVVCHGEYRDEHDRLVSRDLKDLITVLNERTDIQSVWWDLASLPQGARSPLESELALKTSTHLPLLYLTQKVILLLRPQDLQTFSCCYDAFLAFHMVIVNVAI